MSKSFSSGKNQQVMMLGSKYGVEGWWLGQMENIS